MNKFHIIIADDHPLVLMGIRELLERDPGIVVDAAAESPSELMERLERYTPDAVITDYSMPDDDRQGDGLQFIGLLLRRFSGLKVVVLTRITNPMIVASLYDIGVSGVVLKRHNLSELTQALQTIRRGQHYYPPGFQKLRSGELENSMKQRIDSLTPREFEVLRLFVQGGRTMGEIGEHLNRSIKTVSAQKTAAMRKLGVATTPDLIRFCAENEIFLK